MKTDRSIEFFKVFLFVVCVEYCQCREIRDFYDGIVQQNFPEEVKSIALVKRQAQNYNSRHGRFFIDSDMVMQMIMQNMDSVPEHFRGPLMFLMGFTQQNMKNFMSNMRSLGQMIITSVVMMAVKKIFFADLPTEADRNKASELTDIIMNLINLVT